MLSIDILPVPTDEAVRDVQSRIMGIESDITSVAAEAEQPQQLHRRGPL